MMVVFLFTKIYVFTLNKTRKEADSVKLTLKQQRFADEYIISGNATQAAIKAGYRKNSAAEMGSSNLRKPHVKNYIDKRLNKLAQETIADQEEILRMLTSVMRGEEKEETLIGVGNGLQAIDDIDVSAKDRIKAAELLGKRYGMWTDRVETFSQNIDITLGDWDED